MHVRSRAALVVIWLLLAAAALVPWLFDAAVLAPVRTAGGAVAGASVPTRAAPPPVDRFAAVTERPLFTASRRPAPDAAEAPRDGSLVLGRYRLSGVVVTPTRRIVLLREEGGKTLSVAQGERLGDWLVADVTRERIVLESDGERRVIRLDPEAAPR